MTLAAVLEGVIEVRGPLPAGTLASEARKRKADVLHVLHTDPRFVHTGRRKASRWHVASPSSVSVEEAATRWDCDPEMAAEIIFGPEGFVERGLVSSLNGNGRVVVTAKGCALARSLSGHVAREAA